jgi:hypothetical protein
VYYTVRCPHCLAVQTRHDTALWPGTFLGRSGEAEHPGDPSEPQACRECAAWMRLVLIGKDDELTVEKCEAPEPDPPDILDTGI